MSRALDRLAPLATTGVGSLPFTAPDGAVRHAARAYDVPFCPQLPRLDGDMVRQWLGGDPARCGWSPDRDRERPAAWDAFAAHVAAAPPPHRVVKLQVTGPITLAVALERGAGRLGCGPGMVVLAREIAGWLAVGVAEQAGRLRTLGLDALLLVDEPGLAQPGLADHDVTVWDDLRAAGVAAWGLHVCGALPWRVLERAEPDVLSFDLAHYWGEPAARAALARHVRRGGRVAWGVVDPVDCPASGDAAACAAAALASLRPLAPDAVAAASLLTPACGTGRLAQRQERLVAATLDAVAVAARGAVRATGPAGTGRRSRAVDGRG